MASKYDSETALSENNLVTKHNRLIEGAYKLTETEQKIILTLISLVQPEDQEFAPITFSIKDFAKLVGTTSDRYKEVEEITKKLLSKVHEIRLGDQLHQIQWLSQATYNYTHGTVTLTLHNFFKPYLLDLKNQFTSYRLKNISTLKSHYAIRIYELLAQYVNSKKKERTFTVLDLREKLGALDVYPLYANFKQRVLLPSKKQINEKTNLKIDFEEFKKGRSVEIIKFTFDLKDSLIKPLPKPPGDEEEIIEVPEDLFEVTRQEDIKDLHKLSMEIGFKVPKKVLEQWLDRNTKNKIVEAMEIIRFNPKIDNPIGMITYVLKNNVNEYVELSPIEEAITAFIAENVPKQKVTRLEQQPDWMYKDSAIEIFSKYIPEKDAEELWDVQKDEIMEKLKERRSKMLIKR